MGKRRGSQPLPARPLVQASPGRARQAGPWDLGEEWRPEVCVSASAREHCSGSLFLFCFVLNFSCFLLFPFCWDPCTCFYLSSFPSTSLLFFWTPNSQDECMYQHLPRLASRDQSPPPQSATSEPLGVPGSYNSIQGRGFLHLWALLLWFFPPPANVSHSQAGPRSNKILIWSQRDFLGT